MVYKIAIDTVFFNRTYSGISKVWENILLHLSQYISQNTGNTGDTAANIPYEIILLIRGQKLPVNILNSKINEKYKCLFIPDFQYELKNKDLTNKLKSKSSSSIWENMQMQLKEKDKQIEEIKKELDFYKRNLNMKNNIEITESNDKIKPEEEKLKKMILIVL